LPLQFVKSLSFPQYFISLTRYFLRRPQRIDARSGVAHPSAAKFSARRQTGSACRLPVKRDPAGANGTGRNELREREEMAHM
jgi:hypothetical protein